MKGDDWRRNWTCSTFHENIYILLDIFHLFKIILNSVNLFKDTKRYIFISVKWKLVSEPTIWYRFIQFKSFIALQRQQSYHLPNRKLCWKRLLLRKQYVSLSFTNHAKSTIPRPMFSKITSHIIIIYNTNLYPIQ